MSVTLGAAGPFGQASSVRLAVIIAFECEEAKTEQC